MGSSYLRAALNFAVSVQVANYLTPGLYGNYQYLLTVSTAIMLFFNMGSENAFFTFISKKQQHINFYILYLLWQLTQILFVLVFLFVIHRDVYTFLYKDFNIGLVILAISASFFVGNIQSTINHIAESIRKTYLSQSVSIFVAFIHVVAITGVVYFDCLTISLLFKILFFEYFLYALIIFLLLKKYRFELFNNDIFVLSIAVNDFYVYCRPLFFLGLFNFLYVIIDRWLIQTYVGTEGQAFFSISMQFSTLVILMTSGILNIFWKEISESIELNNLKRSRIYFRVVSSHLFTFSCVVSAILFFYSEQILSYFYTDAYIGALVVFKLIMIYPVVQSMGQLYSVFLLAAEKTKLFKDVSIFISGSSILVAILLLSDFGFNAGVEGIALKIVIMNFFLIVILEYYICNYLGIDTIFLVKLKSLILSFFCAFIVHEFQSYMDFPFLVQVTLVGFLYVLPIGLYLFNSLQRQLIDA